MLNKIKVGDALKVKLRNGQIVETVCEAFYPVKGAFRLKGLSDMYHYNGNISVIKKDFDIVEVLAVSSQNKKKKGNK